MQMKKDGSSRINKLLELVNESNIASIKNVASGILKIINDIHSNAKDLENLIKLDPPLTAKILKVANSSYYSTGQKITTIDDAVVRVGIDTLNFLVLGQKVRDVFEKGEIYEGYSRFLLWKHCFAVSTLGKLIYKNIFNEGGEHIFTAGLLHDIGIIAEDQFMEEEFKEILKRMSTENKSLIDIENDVLGFTHAEFGQAILDQWNLPQELVRAVGFHHKPLDASEKYQKITYSLFLADYLCHQAEFGYHDANILNSSIAETCCSTLGINQGDIDVLMSELAEEVKKFEEEGIFS